jgi:hypothetical protein
MNYFEEPPVDLFGGFGDDTQDTPVVDPDAARRTAQLAALASPEPVDQSAYNTVIGGLEAKAQSYMDRIQAMGEASVRDEIAASRQQERAEAFNRVIQSNLVPDGDPELVQGATAAYTNLMAMRAEEERNTALEQQAVRRVQDLAASGNIAQARLMLGNLERGNALDVIADYQAKQAILQSALDRARFAKEDQNWVRDAADFIMSAIPLYAPSRTGNVDVAESVKNWYDSFFSGERYRNEADSLWDMNPADLAEFVNGDFLDNIHENANFFGYTNRTEELELIAGLVERTPSAFETNAWAAVDIAGFVPWTKAARLGGGLTSMMIRTGARTQAVDATVNAARTILQENADSVARAGMTADNVLNNMQVSAVAPEGSLSRVPIAVDASSALQRGQALLATRLDLESRARLSAEELQHAQEVTAKRLERQFTREVKDVSVERVELSGGSRVNRTSFTLGRKNGGGFANEGQANRYGGSIGHNGTAIQDESGQWFYRVTEDIPETGFFTRLLSVKTPSPWRFLFNARNVGDEALADAAQVAGNARNRLLKTLVEPYENTFRGLRGDEREAVAQVLQAGDTLGKWFDKDTLGVLWQRTRNRPPTARELEAYQAAVDINDMEFALRNDDLYTQRQVKGYRTTSFDTGRGRVDRANAIIDRELKGSPPKTRIFDVSTGKHYTDDMTQTRWNRLRGKGYQLVTLEVPLKMSDGTTIKTFLVKGQDMMVENLKRDQIAYRPGGHRMYDGQYFVKQTVVGRQGDTGKEFLENPNTYIVAKTKAEAKYWASRMEAARLAHLDGADLSVIDEIFGGEAGFPTAEDFVRQLDDPLGAYQKDKPFGVYFDREMPDEYVLTGEALEFVDPEDTGFNGFLRQTGRMYTGRKGEVLPDFQGERAVLLDPFETINRSLMNISALTAFGDYKIQSVERWMKTFGKYIDRTNIPEDWSDLRIFMEAPLSKGGNEGLNRIRSAALAQRQIIKRTLGWKTENDLRADQWARHLSEWVAGDMIDGVVPSIRRAVSGVDWLQDANPVAALRSFAFDLKLGMFNVAQLPLQLSTAVAATAMSPEMGMKGWAMIAPMRFAMGSKLMSKEVLEGRLDELIKRGVHDLGGFESAKDFKDFARAMTRSGFFDLGGTHGLMDSYGAHSTMNGFASGVDRVREAGRFFFFEAERWNRMVAWRIAWDETRKAGLKAGTPEFAAKLAGRAEEYSFNMSRESQAWWQKGVLSIPTQFWAYNARMLEAMTVGNFTTAQKLRLLASQSLLYGSAGIPVVSAISSFAKGKDPDMIMEGGDLELEANPFDSPFATLDRGLIDQAVLSFTGADVLVGARYGTGGWVPEVVKNIFGMSSYGEVSAADLLGGATYNIMGKVGSDVLRPITEYMAAESGDQGMPIRREALMRLASNVSILSNLHKSSLVYNYGTLVSGSGTTLVDELPSQVAFATMLGINPAEMDQIAAISSMRTSRSDRVKEASKIFMNYRVAYAARPDQRETIMEEINLYARMLPPDIRREALERTQGATNPSLYSGLVEFYEQNEAETETNGPTN